MKLLLLCAAAALTACSQTPSQLRPRAVATADTGPTDRAASAETRALFASLRRLADTNVLFGHQDSLAYGVHWRGEPDRSDVRDVAGAYPAVYGWDVARLFRSDNPDAADADGAKQLRQWIREGHARGGVITLSWHMPNPVKDTNSWDTTAAVGAIIPGGALHQDYLGKLDVIAEFLSSLRAADGSAIPVIFRPFHEHSGDWFWWGRAHTSADDFVSLWRSTVSHLRDARRVHNVLYAYSTDVFDSEAAYLERYPGDDVIDLLGFDDYHSIKSAETRCTLVKRLQIVAQLARRRGKLAALTETGVEAIPDPRWWTQILLPALKAQEASGISYALVWRNANRDTDRKDHFYAPYAGHASAADFVAFKRDPFVLFEDELPPLYKDRRAASRSRGEPGSRPSANCA